MSKLLATSYVRRVNRFYHVNIPVMDKLKSSHFLQHMTGDISLSQFEGVTTLTRPAQGAA